MMPAPTAMPVLAATDDLFDPDFGGFWAGAWQSSPRRLRVEDPDDFRELGTVVDASAADAARAVEFIAGRWRARPWPLWERRQTMAAAAEALERLARPVAAMLSAESAKTVTEATREVGRAIETLRLTASAASVLEGSTVPFADSRRGSGWTGWWRREPLGIVLAITPFNDPLNLVAHKLGPALLAGNPVILKPSHATPFSAIALVRLLLEAGTPPEYLALLAGQEAAQALVEHPDIDAISFTGGPTAADAIAAGGRARKVMMELGGNNALIACADADPIVVAAEIVDGAFGVAGQNCLSVQRAFIHHEIYDRTLAEVLARTSALRTGPKSDPATDVGPLISQEAAVRITEWLDEAIALGATLRIGGVRDGARVTPAVLTDAPHGAKVWQEEVFGPVVCLEPFTDVAGVIEHVNEVDTGLQAGVFTQDIDLAFRFAEQLVVGAVLVNSSPDFRIDAMPFGGFKRSGIGREGVRTAVEAFSEPKVVAIRSGAGSR